MKPKPDHSGGPTGIEVPRAPALPTVELWESAGFGVVIEFPSGVLYSNQTGGFSCCHPTVEGVFVPLRNDVSLSGEAMGPETELLAYFEGPKHGGNGATLGIDEEDARFIESVMAKYGLAAIHVNRSLLRKSHEAWVHVTIDATAPEMSCILKGFAQSALHAIATWCNSD